MALTTTTIIPCIHNKGTNVPPHVSGFNRLTVVLIHQELLRVIFHRDDGKLVTTPYGRCSPGNVLKPFNPFCVYCKENYLNCLTSFGLSTSEAHQCLEDLYKRVNEKIDEIDRKQCVNCNDGSHDDHALFDETVMYDMAKMDERHSFDQEELRTWLEEDAMRPKKTSPWELPKLERIKVEEMESLSMIKDESCCVCLEDLVGLAKDGQEKVVLRLPCGHVFHEDCVKKWLDRSCACPLCRFELPSVVYVP